MEDTKLQLNTYKEMIYNCFENSTAFNEATKEDIQTLRKALATYVSYCDKYLKLFNPVAIRLKFGYWIKEEQNRMRKKNIKNSLHDEIRNLDPNKAEQVIEFIKKLKEE